MGRLRLVILVGVFLLFCLQITYAERLAPKLTLREAVDTALSSHVNMKQAETSRLDALSKLRVASFQTTYGIGSIANVQRESQSNYFSTRSFGSLQYSNFLGTTASIDVSPFGYGTERGALGFELRHPLLRGKGRYSDRAAELFYAQNDVAIGNKSYFQSQQSTVLNVVKAYYRAILAREQVKVQTKALENAQTAADGARQRSDEGLVPEIEVSRAEIRVSQTREQLNQAEQSAKAAMDSLMLAVGTGVGSTPELTDAVPGVDVKQLPPLEDAITTAVNQSPDMEVFDQQLSSQNRKLQLARDSLRSGLDVVAGINASSANEGLLSGSSLYDAGSFTMGLEYSFPLDRRALFEDRAVAERGLDLLKEQKTYQSVQVANAVRSAYRDVQTAQESLDILGKNVSVAEENLRFAQLRLDEGLDDNRNVLEAQAALTQAELGYESAKIDLYLARVQLRYAMGEDLTTPGAL